jgi:nucleotide-binding universal stress UspA family protein
MEIARELDGDLIVGRRDQNPVGRMVLGSVSTKVVHGALCDVLVVS